MSMASSPPPPYAPPHNPPAGECVDNQIDWMLIAYIAAPMFGLVLLFSLYAAVRDHYASPNRRRRTVNLEDGIPVELVDDSGARINDSDAPNKTRWSRTPSSAQARPRSAWAARASGSQQVDLAALSIQIRMAFLRKVYLLLSLCLAYTVAIVIGFTRASFVDFDPATPTPFYDSFSQKYWIVYILIVPLLVSMCILHCVKRIYPWNYVALFFFVTVESLVLSFVTVMYFAQCYGDQVIVAAFLTFTIFVTLTAFTLQSRFDFTFLLPILCVLSMVLAMWMIVNFVLYFSNSEHFFRAYQLYSLGAAIFMALFIIFDTHMIMKYCGVDDFIIAVIELYLDVVQLFMYLLGAQRKD